MVLLLGGYQFLVELPEIQFNQLPKQWHSYISQEKMCCDYTILVTTSLKRSCNNKDAHWETILINGVEESIFYKNSEAVFSIKICSASNCVYLTVSDGRNRALMLGIHYSVMLVLLGNTLGLHCVTVLCHDQAICLAAPSGTGKTTLANLLVKYGDAAILNGDFALLSPEEDGKVIFEPTPFCGTSGICHNYRVKIDRIVFLEQGLENRFSELSVPDALRRLLSNTFVPTWDAERTALITETAAKLVERLPVSLFSFAPTAEAVDVFYQAIEKDRIILDQKGG